MTRGRGGGKAGERQGRRRGAGEELEGSARGVFGESAGRWRGADGEPAGRRRALHCRFRRRGGGLVRGELLEILIDIPPVVGLLACQLSLDAGGLDDGEPRGVDQGGVLGALPGLDDATKRGEQAPRSEILGLGLRCAKLDDTVGDIALPGEAAGMAPVAHETGGLIGVDQQRALGARLGEGFVAGVLEGGHGVGSLAAVSDRSGLTLHYAIFLEMSICKCASVVSTRDVRLS